MMLRMDSVTKLNVDLIKRYRDGVFSSNIAWKNKPMNKLNILGEIARFRLNSQSDIALDKLESWVDKNNIDMMNWPHGQTARALLYIDRGMIASAVNIVKKTMKEHPRHPHLRRLAIYLAYQGEMELPSIEPTGLVWADTKGGEWKKLWSGLHNVVPCPELDSATLKEHAWQANAWVVRKEMEELQNSKKAWRKLNWSEQPFANHLILTGIITSVGSLPVDLGLPGWLNFKAIDKAELLDL